MLPVVDESCALHGQLPVVAAAAGKQTHGASHTREFETTISISWTIFPHHFHMACPPHLLLLPLPAPILSQLLSLPNPPPHLAHELASVASHILASLILDAAAALCAAHDMASGASQSSLNFPFRLLTRPSIIFFLLHRLGHVAVRIGPYNFAPSNQQVFSFLLRPPVCTRQTFPALTSG